jgi:hypothetical protein
MILSLKAKDQNTATMDKTTRKRTINLTSIGIYSHLFENHRIKYLKNIVVQTTEMQMMSQNIQGDVSQSQVKTFLV